MEGEKIESCPEFGPKYEFCPDADWWKQGISYGAHQTERLSSPPPSLLEQEFNERADRWETEAAIHSSPGSKFLHKDFVWIITRGKIIVPLILDRLNTSQSDWFWALENITQENPAKDAVDFESAVKAWQEWGRDHSTR